MSDEQVQRIVDAIKKVGVDVCFAIVLAAVLLGSCTMCAGSFHK